MSCGTPMVRPSLALQRPKPAGQGSAGRDQTMAERPRQQAKKRPVKPASEPKLAAKAQAVAAAPETAAMPTAAHVRALQAERDQFAIELKAAKARIAALEEAREQVLNRIDWVIDSLHSLTND